MAEDEYQQRANNILNSEPSLFYRIFRKIIFRFLYYLFCLLPLNSKKVLFASDSRTDMSGNFEFVYRELKKEKKDYQFRFLLKASTSAPKTYGELTRLAYDLATTKFIVVDDFYPIVYPLKIRTGAEFIQLWHAVGAFKTFGYSRVGRPGGPDPHSKNHRNYTKAIVSSKNVAKHYAEGFGIKEEKVIATGIPRTDVFFDQEYQRNVIEELYSKYPFLREKKVIIFAPTFRGDGQQSAFYPQEYLDLKKLYDSLHDEYVFLFKMHPFVKEYWQIPTEFNDFFYDFSDYREINDLLFISDLLITDYSSVCFEYALLNKPMIFYSPDVLEYIESRDFYYNYDSFVPGPLVRTQDELIKTIKSKQFKMSKNQTFVEYFFDYTDGKSSKRVVAQLFN